MIFWTVLGSKKKHTFLKYNCDSDYPSKKHFFTLKCLLYKKYQDKFWTGKWVNTAWVNFMFSEKNDSLECTIRKLTNIFMIQQRIKRYLYVPFCHKIKWIERCPNNREGVNHFRKKIDSGEWRGLVNTLMYLKNKVK